MKLLSWNIRGLNMPLKQKEIRRMVFSHRISILCLLETRVKQDNFPKVAGSMLPGWEIINNYSKHCLGKIWICWDPGGVKLEVFDIHSQVITCRVISKDSGANWVIFAVYGATNGPDRRCLWTKLQLLKATMGRTPWMITGEFVGCLQHLEIDDIAFTGCYHTWTNKQPGSDFVSKKLDRVLANGEWFTSFSNTAVEFLERGVLDHSPALVTVAKLVSNGPKPFKFFNFWAEHKNFLEWIEEGWRVEVSGFSMFRLYAKLKVVKAVLKAKNREIFGGLGLKVLQARSDLAKAQSEFLASRDNADCQKKKERECLHLLVSLSAAEENFLKQKSRVNWLNLGDGNNAFFHKSVKIRNSSNLIKMLKDDHGNSILDMQEIKELAITFYKNLLGCSSREFSPIKAKGVASLFKKRFSVASIDRMEAPVTRSEI